MKKLIVLIGATGVGKTAVSIHLAKALGCPILSSDSRQLYRELPIGTAAPTKEELAEVPHYFIGTHSIFDSYNAGQYEEDALKKLREIYASHNIAILSGGSMMYIDAVCNGLDQIPTIDQATRHHWRKIYDEKGLAYIQEQLKIFDEKHYEQVDLKNHKRVLHALEVCTVAGQPYSNLRTGRKKRRDFEIIKIGLHRERSQLYERINQRVDKMVAEGLIREAQRYFSHRHLNPLNTVGYKEIYYAMEGNSTLEEALEKIKKNSRNYAKRQLTWYRKDESIVWFEADNMTGILEFAKQHS